MHDTTIDPAAAETAVLRYPAHTASVWLDAYGPAGEFGSRRRFYPACGDHEAHALALAELLAQGPVWPA